jgi:hypothetical protein
MTQMSMTLVRLKLLTVGRDKGIKVKLFMNDVYTLDVQTPRSARRNSQAPTRALITRLLPQQLCDRGNSRLG